MSHKSLTQRGYVVKKKHLTKEQIKQIEKDLTFQPIVMSVFENLGRPKKFFTFLESTHRYYLPRYYAEDVFGPPEINHLTNSSITTDYKVYWDLLPHQMNIWNKLTEQFVQNGKGGILSIPCGAGKTFLAIKLGSLLKKKMIVVVNKEFLLKQWKDAIQKCSNASVGIIQKNKIDIENKDIVIAMLHSLSMKEYPEEIFKDFGFAVVDECFPYGQHINTSHGPMKIGQLYNMWERKHELPEILSFNEQLDKFEYKKMTYAWKKTTNKLIQFKFGDKIVKCTENHLFLTNNGWIKAQNIKVDDLIKGSNRFFGWDYIKVSEKNIIHSDHDIDVYDIEVEDNHNFLVNDDMITNIKDITGIIAHNCHHISSQTFSQALPKISCQYTLGLSATPIRKDGLTQVFLNYLGPIFHSEKRCNINRVWIKFIEIKSSMPNFDIEIMKCTGTKDTGKMTTNISNFTTLNHLILEICRILVQNPDKPRKILILGARREQLEWLHEKWQELGHLNYNKKYATGGLYYGNKQMNKINYWKMLEESAKCDILWGTNDIAKEGLDIPDLNTLILLSGGQDVEQAVGRILRKHHDTVPPTVIDLVYKCGNFAKHASNRRDYYEQSEFLCHKITLDIDDNEQSAYLHTKKLETFLESYTEKNTLKPLKKNKQKLTIPIANRPIEFGTFKADDNDSNGSGNGENIIMYDDMIRSNNNSISKNFKLPVLNNNNSYNSNNSNNSNNSDNDNNDKDNDNNDFDNDFDNDFGNDKNNYNKDNDKDNDDNDDNKDNSDDNYNYFDDLCIIESDDEMEISNIKPTLNLTNKFNNLINQEFDNDNDDKLSTNNEVKLSTDHEVKMLKKNMVSNDNDTLIKLKPKNLHENKKLPIIDHVTSQKNTNILPVIDHVPSQKNINKLPIIDHITSQKNTNILPVIDHVSSQKNTNKLPVIDHTTLKNEPKKVIDSFSSVSKTEKKKFSMSCL